MYSAGATFGFVPGTALTDPYSGYDAINMPDVGTIASVDVWGYPINQTPGASSNLWLWVAIGILALMVLSDNK